MVVKAMLSSEDGGRSSTFVTQSPPFKAQETRPPSSGESLNLWHAALSIARKAASDVGDGGKAAGTAFSQGYSAARQDLGDGNVLGAAGDLSEAGWHATKAIVPQLWAGATDAVREGDAYEKRLYDGGVDWGTHAVTDRFGSGAGQVFHDSAEWVGDSLAANQATNLGLVEGVAEGAGSLVGGTVDLGFGVYDYQTQGSDYRDGVNHAALNIVEHPDRVAVGVYRAGMSFGKETWHAVATGDNEHAGRNIGRLGFEIASVCVVPEADGAKLPGLLTLTKKTAVGGLGPRATNAVADAGKSGEIATSGIVDDASKTAADASVPAKVGVPADVVDPPARTLVVGGGKSFRAPAEGEVFLNIVKETEPHILGDMRQIPIKGGQFDQVFFERVQYRQSPFSPGGSVEPQVLSEAFRLLKPGGELTVRTGQGLAYDGDARSVALTTLRNLGFEDVTFSTVAGGSSKRLSLPDLPEDGFGVIITARKPG